MLRNITFVPPRKSACAWRYTNRRNVFSIVLCASRVKLWETNPSCENANSRLRMVTCSCLHFTHCRPISSTLRLWVLPSFTDQQHDDQRFQQYAGTHHKLVCPIQNRKKLSGTEAIRMMHHIIHRMRCAAWKHSRITRDVWGAMYLCSRRKHELAKAYIAAQHWPHPIPTNSLTIFPHMRKQKAPTNTGTWQPRTTDTPDGWYLALLSHNVQVKSCARW